MFKRKKIKKMIPLKFHNESVGMTQPMNQHQVQKDVLADKKVTMKDVFGVKPSQKPNRVTSNMPPKPKPKPKPKANPKKTII